jgi:hypothetical protein
VFVVSDGTAAVEVSANTEDALHSILNLKQGVRRKSFEPGGKKVLWIRICELPFIF